jgi:hypothetical protein
MCPAPTDRTKAFWHLKRTPGAIQRRLPRSLTPPSDETEAIGDYVFWASVERQFREGARLARLLSRRES